jgi:hypothetical protein
MKAMVVQALVLSVAARKIPADEMVCFVSGWFPGQSHAMIYREWRRIIQINFFERADVSAGRQLGPTFEELIRQANCLAGTRLMSRFNVADPLPEDSGREWLVKPLNFGHYSAMANVPANGNRWFCTF